jgi:hypothetical protein
MDLILDYRIQRDDLKRFRKWRWDIWRLLFIKKESGLREVFYTILDMNFFSTLRSNILHCVPTLSLEYLYLFSYPTEKCFN